MFEIKKSEIITIDVGNNKSITLFMHEFLMPLYTWLQDLSINVIITYYNNEVNKDDDRLHIGIYNHVSIENMPKKYIMFHIEPFLNTDDVMIEKMNKAEYILTHYICNVPEHLQHKVFIYPFPIYKNVNMYNVTPIKYQYDVSFIGCINDKRMSVINLLKKSSISVHCPTIRNRGVWTNERDMVLMSSKLVILILYYSGGIDFARISYFMNNKIYFVIICTTEEEYETYKSNDITKNLPILTLDNCCDNIRHMLEHDELREETCNINYQIAQEKLRIENYIALID